MENGKLKQKGGIFELRGNECKNLKRLVDNNPQLTERSINQTLYPSDVSINFEKILNKVIRKTKQMDEVWDFKRGKV